MSEDYAEQASYGPQICASVNEAVQFPSWEQQKLHAGNCVEPHVPSPKELEILQLYNARQ